MAEMVDQFNKLVDEHRYAEAEVVANRLYEMAPDELVAQQINKQAKMIRREGGTRTSSRVPKNGVADTFLKHSPGRAERLLATRTRISSFGERLGIDSRTASRFRRDRCRSIKELEIEQKLKTHGVAEYDETPLTKVVEAACRNSRA